MDRPDALLTAARAQIARLLALEPRLLLALHRTPDYSLNGDLRAQLLELRNLAARIDSAQDAEPRPLVRLEGHPGSPSIKVFLDADCIGWIHEATIVDNVDQTQARRIGFTVYRPNKWMFKRPHCRTFEAALARLIAEWSNRDAQDAGERDPAADAEAPPRLWDLDRLAASGVSRGDALAALNLWISLVRVTGGRNPTVIEAASAIGLDPDAVRELLQTPVQRLQPIGWNPADATIAPA